MSQKKQRKILKTKLKKKKKNNKIGNSFGKFI